uniref:Ras-GEF domain-containing family member 1B n=1 Tax=Neogobius melanostomus TaxID=47308 RepID=A0A8C6WP76_9GOBI
MPQTFQVSSQASYLHNGLCYHGNRLVSGPLEALIGHLLPTAEYYPDKTYVFTFLLSSRLFLQPQQLLKRLSEHSSHQGAVKGVAPKLLRLLSEWSQSFPCDFRDQRTMQRLKKLSHRLLCTDQVFRTEEQLKPFGLSVLGEYEQALGQIPAAAVERLTPRRDPPPEMSLSTPSSWAQQLTLIELERLSYVGAEEFVQVFMSRGAEDSEKSADTPSKTPFLDAYVDWFNRLSSLVATEICLPEKKKQRAQVLDFFIDAAQECLNIGNFNSLMAVMSGLSMAPVSRLRRTWNRVNTDKFHILECLMDPSCNFYNYRTALRGAKQRSRTAHSSHEKMVIPFFSLLLKDMYFLNEGCSTRLANGHINFQKCWELAKRVSEFMSWRRVECPFEKERPILQYLLTAPSGAQTVHRALTLAIALTLVTRKHVDVSFWKFLSKTVSLP